jgi:hypothetical protein
MFPKGKFAGEASLVNELSKVEGGNQSVLQQCNDADDLIYVQFQRMQDGKVIVDGKGNYMQDIAGMSYLRLKRELRLQKTLSFITINTIMDEHVKVISDPIVVGTIFVGEVEDAKINKFVFFGDGMGSLRSGEAFVSSKMKITVQVQGVVKNMKSILLFPCEDNECAQELVDLIRKMRSGGRILNISGMEMPEVVMNKEGVSVQKMFILVNEFKMYDDLFSDVKEIIPYINEFDDLAVFCDVKNGKLLYPEEVNTILMFDVMYVRLGEPALNVILSGTPGSAKTSCAQLLSKVFSDDGTIILANMSTAKGLVPSYGGEPHPGLLIEPQNFVKVVDEFFRRAQKEALSRGMEDPTSYIYSYLTEAMNVVERRADVLAGSGKGQLPKGTFMRDSFLATDNVDPDVRKALSTAIVHDKAVMRRFTFLQIRAKEAAEVRGVEFVPPDDEIYEYVDAVCRKKGYSLKQMARFGRWFRREVGKVLPDRMMCVRATEGIMRELLADVLKLRGDQEVFDKWCAELNLIPFYEAFVRCCTLMRHVFKTKVNEFPERPYNVSLFDYYNAERLFRRLFVDTFDIYREGIVQATVAMQQGVVRMNVGFKNVGGGFDG